MHFPLFINLKDTLVVVIGGGQIATRRILTLLKFDCKIKLIAPSITSELQELATNGNLEYIHSCYDSSFLIGAGIVIAATNERCINHKIYQDATAAGLLINVADNKQECSFFFPAIFETEHIIGGLISKAGHDHTLVKQTAKQIRTILNGGN